VILDDRIGETYGVRGNNEWRNIDIVRLLGTRALVAGGTVSQPLVVLSPPRRWAFLNLGELRGYHELLYFLIVRDIKLRYQQMALGVAWALLQPLASMLIFTLFLGRLGGVMSTGVPYPLFAYAGLLLWSFFSNAVSSASTSLIATPNLVTKVYFPRLITPAAAVLAALVDFAIGFPLLLGLMVYYGVAVTWGLLAVPVVLILLTLLALAVGTWMAGVNVKYRDVRYALPFLIQLWMFASPIIYPATLVPERWRWALRLNPVAALVEAFRAALFGGRFPWGALAGALAVTLVVAAIALLAFAKLEDSFSDVI
jgi:lipopolysaccharide transport system permease protein